MSYKDYEGYTESQIELELNDLEYEADQCKVALSKYGYDSDERGEAEEKLKEISESLSSMEEYVPDSFKENYDKLVFYVMCIEYTEYDPDYGYDPDADGDYDF